MAADQDLADYMGGLRSPVDLRQALQEMLLQRLSQDPSLAGVAPLLLSRFTAAAAEGEPAAADERPPEAAEPSPGVRRLHEAVAAAAAEERRLRDLLAQLAAALGACTSCLGSEPACMACSGFGGPGFAEPDEQAFAQWVGPAAARRGDKPPASGQDARTTS
jgi:hypothetical protein